jgi:excisionase family DNA binding protein
MADANSDISVRAASAVAEQERRRQAKLRKKQVEKRVGRAAYSPEEFAALMRVDQATVFRWIKNRKVHSAKIGGRRFIPVAEVERLLAGAAS